MTWLTAIGEGLAAAKLWMQRAWGTQSREQALCQEAAEIALKNKREAYRRAWNAQNQEQYELALDDVNYWDARLRELLHEAAAKWG